MQQLTSRQKQIIELYNSYIDEFNELPTMSSLAAYCNIQKSTMFELVKRINARTDNIIKLSKDKHANLETEVKEKLIQEILAYPEKSITIHVAREIARKFGVSEYRVYCYAKLYGKYKKHELLEAKWDAINTTIDLDKVDDRCIRKLCFAILASAVEDIQSLHNFSSAYAFIMSPFAELICETYDSLTLLAKIRKLAEERRQRWLKMKRR